MAKRVQLVRHDATDSALFTGLIGEVTVNTTANSLIIHNGVTPGGFEQARADLANVSAASVSGAGKMTAAQVSELTTATADIATNVTDIATNVTNIATNATNIATNVTNISTNATNISTLDTALGVVEAYFTANVLEIAHGGTAGATASAARTNLGLAIGSDVQAYDANLTTIAGLTKTNSNFIVGNGTTWVVESGTTVRTSLGLGSLAVKSSINNSDWSGTDLAVVNGGTGSSTASAARTNLGVVIGTNVQAYDAGLQSIAGLTTSVDKMIYTTASDVYAVTALTTFARSVLDDANANTARATLLASEFTHDHSYDTITISWAAGTAYIVGDKRQATSPDGSLYFECTVAGTSHATTEPTWPTVAGGTVVDNAVTWTARNGEGDLLIEESFSPLIAGSTYIHYTSSNESIATKTGAGYGVAVFGGDTDNLNGRFLILRAGTFRCSWEMRENPSNTNDAEGRVYVDGVAFGVNKTVAGITFATVTDDLTFNTGDIVELYIHHQNNGTVEAKNFQLLSATKLFG